MLKISGFLNNYRWCYYWLFALHTRDSTLLPENRGKPADYENETEREREKKERAFEKSPMYVSLLTFLNVRYAVTVTQHGESSTHIVIRITNVTSRIKREQYERWYSETVTSRL